MCVTHWRVVFELWCADESDSLCSWSGKLCAPDSFSRSSCVTLRPPPLPQESSPTPTQSRHFCPSTSVSVCEGPEAFLTSTRSSGVFTHSVRPCCIFVPTQRLLGSPVQSLTAAPHHEPSGVQPYAGGVSHGFQARLVSSWMSSITAERPLPSQPLETCHPCDATEDQAKDSPTKKQAMSPGPHRELLPAEPLATQAPTSGRTTGQTPSLLHPSHAPSDWGSTKGTLCGASSVTSREQL